jgi:ABC-type multidrug transport system fused ATPase/permease subunit
MIATPGSFGWLVRRYALPHARGIALMVLLTLLVSVLAVLQPALLAALLANLAGDPAAPASSTSRFDLNHLGSRVTHWMTTGTGVDVLVLFGVLFVLAAILSAVLSFAAQTVAVWLRGRVSAAMRADLTETLLRQDMAFFTRSKTGELISRVASDPTVTATALGPLILSVVQNSVLIVVYSAYLLGTSIWLTVGSIPLLLAHFGLTQLLKRPTRRLAAEETDATAAFSGIVQETFTSVRVAKSFGAEAFELEKLRAASSELVSVSWRRSRVEKLEAPARSVIDSLALLGVFFLAVIQLRAGHLTFQGLILFTFVGRSLITPINNLATAGLWIHSITAASARIADLMTLRPSIVDGPIVKETFERGLTIDHCSFAYGKRLALNDVTLDIRKGEFIALVGPSGAGKSTLADLILRLHDPAEGAIVVDGVDVRMLKQREYRRLFGVVSQESLLFHDSIRANIRYGRTHVTDEMIEQAARVANAHAFIEALPHGYDTVVGDRGMRLSGGERQRVAIARAVADNPAVLILDEATSALDSESERLVQKAIDAVVARATAIVIAHRLSTVTHADRIVVLNGGSIEAVGRHDQLLESSVTYRRFCELQFGPAAPTVTAS